MAVQQKKFNAPSLMGWPLVIATNILENVSLLRHRIAADALLLSLRDLDLYDEPTTIPIPQEYMHKSSLDNIEVVEPLLEDKRSQSPFNSFWDYHLAYSSGKTTPSEVAQRLLRKLKASDGHYWMRAYEREDIFAQAAASTERYKAGKPLSQLDGVFIPVKEETDIKGFETRGGTSFINVGNPATSDAAAVQRLRDAGAIIVGQTTMNEIGWDVFSINPITGTPNNPYERKSSCGGSSGGSAGAVSSGLFPMALGADGGGSVRIPSSFCGLYGLKTTCGRISGRGSMFKSSTVGVFGPIAATADDMALMYSVMAGPDAVYPGSLHQPPVSLKDYYKTDTLDGIVIAVIADWGKDVVDPDVAKQMETFMEHFKSLGATIITVNFPEIDVAKIAHTLTISAEIGDFAIEKCKGDTSKYLHHTRLLMAAMSECLGRDYYRAQQIRTMAINRLIKIFQGESGVPKADLIISPTVPIVAPEIPKAALKYGMSNTNLTVKTMTFATLANFTGIPAVSVPAGFSKGKPIGLQLMAEWWNEALLLRMAKICENTPGIERKRPEDLWFGDLL